MLTYILYGIFILSCVVLVVTVLLQPGKADAGALFSSGVSSTAFGPRGTQSILAKITIGAAAAYMLFALTLGLPIVTGARSVLQSTEEPAPVASPSPATSQAPAQQAPAALPEASAQPAANTSAPAASPATSPAAKSSPAAKASPSAKK